MTTVINCEREALEFDSVPEFLRDNQLPTREAAVSMSSQIFNARELSRDALLVDSEAPKSDELEALWPGVHHDFEQAPRKTGSFYATVGFMAGAALSLLCVFGYSAVSHVVASKPFGDNKAVMVASVPGRASTMVPGMAQSLTGQDGLEILVPAANNYQVQPGDTLAGIAQKNYKRVSPRLLDQICRANNMRNANVLSLGQKLMLPEYRAQASQVAATSAAQVQ